LGCSFVLVVLLLGAAASCGPSGSRVDIGPPDGALNPGRGGAGGGGGTGGAPGPGGTGGIDPATGGSPGSEGGTGGGPPDVAPDAVLSVDVALPRDTAPLDVARPDAPRPDLAPPPPDLAPPPPDTTPGVNLAMGLITRLKLDEGMGNAVADSGPAANGSTVSGATWIRPGTPNAKYPNPAALRFDGTDDHVVVSNKMMPNNNAAQSVAFFLNYTAAPGGAQVCVALTQPSTESRLKIGFNEGQARAWKSSSDPLVAAAIPAAGWHHMAYTFDGRVNRLYLDGVERAMTTTAPNTGPATEVRLGAIHNNAENFAGDLDDVRFYSRALSAAEVRALAAGAE
jgi:hypothetical protein